MLNYEKMFERNFSEVRKACNAKWNIRILEAQDGIKVHCLSKDAKYFVSLTETTKIMKSAMLIDEIYQKWWLQRDLKKPVSNVG
jgi:hypothetical protein